MPSLGTPTKAQGKQFGAKASNFADSQKIAKRKALEKKAHKKKIKLDDLLMFTQQLASMLEAGLPLVTCLEALQEQVSDPVFQVIIREVKLDVSAGTPFSEACDKYPNAFNKLFVAMTSAGEASGNLSGILMQTATYFEESVKLTKKIKGAMVYPTVVIIFAVLLLNVILIFVIPIIGKMFEDFGSELPGPTLALMALSNFMRKYIFLILIAVYILWKLTSKFVKTPKGRVVKDTVLTRMPIFGELIKKIAITRFTRTFAILLHSGVPILECLDIVSSASNNVFIERACGNVAKNVSQGGQISEVIAADPFFFGMIKHMILAGEQTGNVDGMLVKVSDFYDVEIENQVAALTSLIEPILIVALGTIIGGMVMAIFLPIFKMSTIVG